jgi:hypothetical protein
MTSVTAMASLSLVDRSVTWIDYIILHAIRAFINPLVGFSLCECYQSWYSISRRFGKCEPFWSSIGDALASSGLFRITLICYPALHFLPCGVAG